MTRDQGRPASPQKPGEGAHGERTHTRFIDQLHEPEPRPSDSEPLTKEGNAHEDREQHDEAEKPRNKD